MKKKILLTALTVALLCGNSVFAAENLAPTAVEITASSEYNADYSGAASVDGVVRTKDYMIPEWFTDYESEADLTLTWSSPVTVTKATAYDISREDSNVKEITLTFSDGTVINGGALNTDGTPVEIDFGKAITADSVVIHVVADDDTIAVGLDEIEIFDEAGNNVALNATATASSVADDEQEFTQHGVAWYPETYENLYEAENAINGEAVAKRPGDGEYEWASLGEMTPSITYGFTAPIKVGTIVLYDRLNMNDHVMSGTIEFSDGTKVDFSSLANVGSPLYLDIADIETDTITITVTEYGENSANNGFAEVEIYTEHFENGKPIGEVEETAAPETEATVESEAAAAETVAEESAAAEETAAEEEIAPQTSDAIAVSAGIAAVAGAAAIILGRKKRS